MKFITLIPFRTQNKNSEKIPINIILFPSVRRCHFCGCIFVAFHLVGGTRTLKVLRQVKGRGSPAKTLYLVLWVCPLIFLVKVCLIVLIVLLFLAAS